MGAFFIVRRTPEVDADRLCQLLDDHFRNVSFVRSSEVHTSVYSLVTYHKLSCRSENIAWIDGSPGRFVAGTGTFVTGGRTGAAALRLVGDESDRYLSRFEEPVGSFCLFLGSDDSLSFFTDGGGTYRVYHDEAETIWSSSMLAVATTLPRRTLSIQGLYEYVFHGAVHGGETLCHEIKCLEPQPVHHINAEGVDRSPVPAQTLAIGSGDFKQLVERNVDILRRVFGSIATAAADRIESALSGGYDSRLILGLLQAESVVPRLHVYGAADDPDVAIARTIATGEGLELLHVDKQNVGPLSASEFRGEINQRFTIFDGCPVDGLFADGADLMTRRLRAQDGRILLNGGGGEIYRNFFYLPNRSLPARELIWAFYCQYDPASTTKEFRADKFDETLVEKLLSTLGRTPEQARLSRIEIEYLYPMFRCRFWMGPNNSVNNRLGFSMTPLLAPDTVDEAVRIPLHYKYAGRFEAAMIALLSPRLAGYQTAYGHTLDGQPPVRRRLQELLVRSRPPFIRRETFRWKNRWRRSQRPYYLGEKYLAQVIDPGLPFVSRYLHPDKLADTGQFNRACTLEYLATALRFGDVR